MTGATFTAVTASNNLQTISFERTKRYLRHFRHRVRDRRRRSLLGVVIGEQKKSV